MDKITKLNTPLHGQDNWNDWKFQVVLLMKHHKVYAIAEGTVTRPIPTGAESEKQMAEHIKACELFESQDILAMNILVLNLADDIRQHISSCITTRDMWLKLLTLYEQRSDQRLQRLYNSFFGYKKDPTDDIAMHITKLK